MTRCGAWAFLAVTLVAGVIAGSVQAQEQRETSRKPKRSAVARARGVGAVAVTPVEGPSTLHHLRLDIERSSMGWDGQWGGPSASVPPSASPFADAGNPRGSFVLNGANLYRVSCRACHKPDGSGAPPEINSIIGPVQSASGPWMTQRMKERGRPVDQAFIRDLTSSTEHELRERLKIGGHKMPSYAHLSDQEISVLRPYLDELAGLPGADRQQRQITEPAARIGELIVKGTCHICHDATGPDNTPTTVLNGVIPSLSAVTHQKTLAQFVQKVREGAPVQLSARGVPSRGRMPVFNYLSEAEAESAYSYLIAFPPK